ncbi:protein IQ-DOMAIN 3 [Apium graveolens]|uniref:protein IQ-DOMAIN 3 n=1 Tax=Apium graveolens TaxID=4045 RepID=UPI003D79EB6B
MGKKGSWLSAVKKVLSPEPKEKKDKKQHKSKKKWFGRNKSLDVGFQQPTETAAEIPDPSPSAEEVKLTEAENQQSKHAYSVALATAVAAEAAVASAQAAAEVVRLTSTARYSGKSNEETAAIKIQTAFRGHLARRALRALRGLVRLKTLIQGQSVKRQAATTLRCMQTLARVQSQIRTRRLRMSEENQALQRQLLQKHEKEADRLRSSAGEDWNDSAQSKEQVDANLQQKQEAAIRRERALAYAYSHQRLLRNSSKSSNPTFMDPSNPHWGWSWLERWMASRPWESRNATDRELNSDRASVNSATSHAISVGARRDLNFGNRLLSPAGQKLSRPPSRQSPSTPPSKAPSSSSIGGKMRPPSPRGSNCGTEDDSRSFRSVQSERWRRHSIAGGSSVGDDESLASSPAVPSYMEPTQSAKARYRLPSPLGMENSRTPEKQSPMGTAKKRLSFSSSTVGPRRHSGPPMMDSSSVKDITVDLKG